MTILIDLTSLYFHFTGIERYAANMTKQMLDRHPESGYILVFANEIPEMFGEYKKRENIRMIVLPCRSRLWFNQIRLPVSLYRHKADVYFFPSFCAPWMFWGHAVVSTIHDMSDFECWRGKQRLKVMYSRLGIYHAKHSAKRILTVSEFSKNRICSILGIAREKVHIAYNGVFNIKKENTKSWEAIKDKYVLPSRYLLSVSTLEPRKNIKLLIDAFSEIMQEDDSLNLVLCGRAGWNMKEVLGSISTAHDRIRITGYIEDEDLPEIYRHAELFVFPSKYEGFGIPPLEAMSMGCPVISSYTSSMPEILEDAAIYFKSDDRNDLIRRIWEMLSMPQEEKRSIIDKGLMQAKKYCWGDESEKVYAALMQAAEQN